MNNERLDVRRYQRGDYETLCQDHLTLAEEVAGQLRQVSDQLPDEEAIVVTFPDETTTVVDIGQEGSNLRYRYDARERRGAGRGLTVKQTRENDEWEEMGDGTDFSHIGDFYRLLLARHNAAIKSGVLHPDSSPWNNGPRQQGG